MKVSITKSEKKRKYEYRTLTIKTKLKGWQIATMWGNKAPIFDVGMNENGDIVITIAKKLNHL